jgi:hypothetical protein
MLPAVFSQREFVMLGGLMSYGSSLSDLYRRKGFVSEMRALQWGLCRRK